MVFGLGLATDDVAVVVELANQVVGLLEHSALGARARHETLDEAIGRDLGLEGHAAAVVDDGEAVPLHQRQDTEDLACTPLIAPPANKSPVISLR